MKSLSVYQLTNLISHLDPVSKFDLKQFCHTNNKFKQLHNSCQLKRHFGVVSMLKIFVAQVIVLKIRIFYHKNFKGDTV